MEAKDTTDELYVLGYIAGLCQHEPRDEVLLDDMLMYLREVGLSIGKIAKRLGVS